MRISVPVGNWISGSAIRNNATRIPKMAAALNGPEDVRRVPAQLVRPSSRVRWLIDRAAAGELLRDARPVSQ